MTSYNGAVTRALVFVAILALGPACADDVPVPDANLILLVELKTDLVPGVEFAAVRTQLFDPGDRTEELTRRQVDVTLGRDLTSGLRVAELGDLAPGTYALRVMLVDLADTEVMGRDVVVTVRETAGVTVLMTRDCRGVACPGAGDDPLEAACLGGRCVDERCTPETPEYCPAPECGTSAECTDVISECADRVCEDGTCFVSTDATMCIPPNNYCDPTDGCSVAELPTWVQAAYIKASNTGANDAFGASVALSADGNTLAVGAMSETSSVTGVGGNQSDDSARGAGAVYVFTRAGDTWTQQAYIKASNTDVDDSFGGSVALSADGNTLAVGAQDEDSAAITIGGNQIDNSASKSGAVYVFTRSGETWAQQAYVKASNTDADDAFGGSVSLSADGNTLAVGAQSEDSAATTINGDQSDGMASSAGAVYVFTRSGEVWSQQAYVKASNAEPSDFFGGSLSLSGDGNTLVVGARGEDSAATTIDGDQSNGAANAGAAYVFARSAGEWTPEAYLKASDSTGNFFFGTTVSISADGNTLVASSSVAIDAAYVFTKSGGSWAEQTRLTASNATNGDRFAGALSLSGDGNSVAVGAAGEAGAGAGAPESDNSVIDAGATYVFRRSGVTWTQEAYLKASATGANDFFGTRLSLSADGSTLAVSATGEASAAVGIGGDDTNDSAPAAGAVYSFTF